MLWLGLLRVVGDCVALASWMDTEDATTSMQWRSYGSMELVSGKDIDGNNLGGFCRRHYRGLEIRINKGVKRTMDNVFRF